jgi:hypothetical protein
MGLACVPCGANTQSTPGTVGGCDSSAGFTPSATSYVACAYGFYKPLAGNHSCTACAAGKRGRHSASPRLRPATCAPRTHAGRQSVRTARRATPTARLRRARWRLPTARATPGTRTQPGRPARRARPATSRPRAGTLPCAPCSGRFFSHVAASSACERCPANVTGGFANDADIDCTCDAGFTGPAGGPCAACECGKYKASQGSAACADCGPAAFWPVGADPAVFACEACLQHSARSSDLGSGVLGCVCDAGYLRTTDTTCSLCPAGSYCPEQHIQRPCPAHSYSAAGSSSLQAGLSAAPRVPQRDAEPGRRVRLEPAHALDAHGFPVTGGVRGRLLPDGEDGPLPRQLLLPLGDSCGDAQRKGIIFVRCPENEFTLSPDAVARAECNCMAGFKLSTSEETARCLPCLPGERCQGGSVLEVECHLQNRAITTDHGQCVCKAGFGFLDFQCQLCPPGFVKPVIGDTAASRVASASSPRTAQPACPARSTPTRARVLRSARAGRRTCCSRTRACSVLKITSGSAKPVPPARASRAPRTPATSPRRPCRLGPRPASARPGTTQHRGTSLASCAARPAGPARSSATARAYSAPPTRGRRAGASRSSTARATRCSITNDTCHSMRVDRTCAGVCSRTPLACVACEPGHHKPAPSTPGNAERCQACAEGRYQPAAAALSCEACPLLEWHTALAATARSQCLCVGGWTRPGSSQLPPQTPRPEKRVKLRHDRHRVCLFTTGR